MAIDLIYFLDILIGFTTSFISPYNGDEYFDLLMIAKHYIRGDFLVDFLSTFWFEELFKYVIRFQNEQLLFLFKVFKLLKVYRIRKVAKLIRGSTATIETKAILQVIYFTLVIVIYTHVVACLLWWMCKTDEIWTPAVDFGSLSATVHVGFERGDRDAWSFFIYQYLTMWYNSSLTFLLVEVNARTHTQITFAVPIYICNAIFNAVLFGVFADQIVIIRGKETAKQQDIDDSNVVMYQLLLPKTLEADIRDYIIKTVYTKALQDEIREFFDERINPDLKKEIIAQVFKEILLYSKIFMQLRVIMREDHKIRKSLHASQKESVNIRAFTETADSKFNNAMN